MLRSKLANAFCSEMIESCGNEIFKESSTGQNSEIMFIRCT